MRKKLVSLLICLAVGLIITSCGNSQEKESAKSEYNIAVEVIKEKNDEAETVINNAQALLDSDKIPYDETTITNLQVSISNLKESLIQIPSIPEEIEDIKRETEDLNTFQGYSELISAVTKSQKAFEDSVKQLEQVTNPTGDFVIQRLANIDDVGDVQGVTEDNDPNGNLNKQGGYTSATYFTSPLVDQTNIAGGDIVAKGTDAGGCIEVYATVEEAIARDAYLAAFDSPGAFSSGSHHVIGTMIVRTSKNLTATQQNELTEQIKATMIKLK